MGTSNRLAQFRGRNFIELFEVGLGFYALFFGDYTRQAEGEDTEGVSQLRWRALGA